MPTAKPKRPTSPNRADAVPALPGVPLDAALAAAMATKLPKGWKPPKRTKVESERPKGEGE